MSWYDAKSDCASRNNGWLVSITSETMNNVVRTNRFGDSFWLGGTCGSNCAYHCGTWVWESGDPWSYSNWWSGDGSQPDFYGGYERCLEMRASDSAWNDNYCGIAILYICQTSSGKYII